jgi:hypothetical protein
VHLISRSRKYRNKLYILHFHILGPYAQCVTPTVKTLPCEAFESLSLCLCGTPTQIKLSLGLNKLPILSYSYYSITRNITRTITFQQKDNTYHTPHNTSNYRIILSRTTTYCPAFSNIGHGQSNAITKRKLCLANHREAVTILFETSW